MNAADGTACVLACRSNALNRKDRSCRGASSIVTAVHRGRTCVVSLAGKKRPESGKTGDLLYQSDFCSEFLQ